jgi:hypothetical protein
MPPNCKKCTPEEGRIAKAIEALNNSDYKSVADAVQSFTVLYQKLLRQHQSIEIGTGSSSHNKALDNIQEQALLVYIKRCYIAGKAVYRHQIRHAANTLLLAGPYP